MRSPPTGRRRTPSRRLRRLWPPARPPSRSPRPRRSRPWRKRSRSGRSSGLARRGCRGRPRREVGARAGRDEVHEETIRPGDAGRQLPEEGVARVDEGALAVPRVEEAARLLALAWIVAFDHGFVTRVPGPGEVEAALLDPPVEVGGCEPVRKGEERARRAQEIGRAS